MKIGVLKELGQGEKRVALVPDIIKKFTQSGFEVLVEAGAGEGTFFNDSAFESAGAQISKDASALLGQIDILVKVGQPQDRNGKSEIDLLKEGTVYVGFLNPLAQPEGIKRLADKKITSFPMELIPRISRAQSMDALSSQAGVAGYKAVLLAADTVGKFFPMLTTAAGTIRPSKVLILGAGVAGLQAIATAKRLGAVVEGFDIRPEVADQVRSLGATFIEIETGEDARAEGGYAKEQSEAARKKTLEVLTQHVQAADVVITTAQVPGKKAPRLITEDMIEGMKPGAVIVDMASEQGGNSAYSKPGETVIHEGVVILGPVNLPAQMPVHASQMYAKNVQTLLNHLVKEKQLNLDFNDEITNGACATHNGEIRNERIKQALGAEQPA